MWEEVEAGWERERVPPSEEEAPPGRGSGLPGYLPSRAGGGEARGISPIMGGRTGTGLPPSKPLNTNELA